MITVSQIDEIYLINQVHLNIRQLNYEVKSLINPDFNKYTKKILKKQAYFFLL